MAMVMSSFAAAFRSEPAVNRLVIAQNVINWNHLPATRSKSLRCSDRPSTDLYLGPTQPSAKMRQAKLRKLLRSAGDSDPGRLCRQ